MPRATAAAAVRDELARRPASHVNLVRALLHELEARDPDGSLVAANEDVARVAHAALDRVLDSSPSWTQHLGPFYDADGVAELLARDGRKLSRQAVHKRKGLLALTTGNGRVVYPAHQFRGRQPLPGLDAVLEVLSEELVSRWTVASWLFSDEPELGGERPVDVLADGGPEAVAAVLGVARRWAAQLAA